MIPVIRKAKKEHIKEIFILLKEAFRDYLEFTPYISKESINLIKRDIILQNESVISTRIWRVAEMSDKIVGFYCVNLSKDKCYLNYIGVKRTERGIGLGNFMINDIESIAMNNGSSCVGLEVFKSNEIALGWYKSRGYEEISSRYVYLFKINKKENVNNSRLVLDPLEIKRSLLEENETGFAKFIGKYGEEIIEIALFGKRYLKILKPKLIKEINLLNEISRYFSLQRDYILCSSDREIGSEYDYLRKEILIEMEKKLT